MPFFRMLQICMTMVFLVDVVLWTILYPQAKKEVEKNDDDDACCEKFLNFGKYCPVLQPRQ